MSVLIRGMEIPKSCRECACYKHKSDPGYYDYDLCGALKATFNETKFDIDPFRDRLENCPLAEVPPHGRLIDGDNVIDLLREQLTGDRDTVYEYYDDGLEMAISELSIVPTIIEAEEEAEK